MSKAIDWRRMLRGVVMVGLDAGVDVDVGIAMFSRASF